MGDLVSLRAARKAATRRRAAQRAAENRLTFGRSKAERALAEARADKLKNELDGSRLERGDRE